MSLRTGRLAKSKAAHTEGAGKGDPWMMSKVRAEVSSCFVAVNGRSG